MSGPDGVRLLVSQAHGATRLDSRLLVQVIVGKFGESCRNSCRAFERLAFEKASVQGVDSGVTAEDAAEPQRGAHSATMCQSKLQCFAHVHVLTLHEAHMTYEEVARQIRERYESRSGRPLPENELDELIASVHEVPCKAVTERTTAFLSTGPVEVTLPTLHLVNLF